MRFKKIAIALIASSLITCSICACSNSKITVESDNSGVENPEDLTIDTKIVEDDTNDVKNNNIVGEITDNLGEPELSEDVAYDGANCYYYTFNSEIKSDSDAFNLLDSGEDLIMGDLNKAVELIDDTLSISYTSTGEGIMVNGNSDNVNINIGNYGAPEMWVSVSADVKTQADIESNKETLVKYIKLTLGSDIAYNKYVQKVISELNIENDISSFIEIDNSHGKFEVIFSVIPNEDNDEKTLWLDIEGNWGTE